MADGASSDDDAAMEDDDMLLGSFRNVVVVPAFMVGYAIGFDLFLSLKEASFEFSDFGTVTLRRNKYDNSERRTITVAWRCAGGVPKKQKLKAES